MAKAAADKAPAKDAAAAAETAPPPKKGKGKLILIAVLALVLAGGGGGAWFFMSGSKAGHEKKVEAPKKPIFHALEQFTVNLLPEGGDDQYLQVAINLKLGNEKAVEHLKLHDPELRNRILLILSSKRASELSALDGKKLLAKEILEASRRPFDEGQEEQEVTDVNFTSFIIQ